MQKPSARGERGKMCITKDAFRCEYKDIKMGKTSKIIKIDLYMGSPNTVWSYTVWSNVIKSEFCKSRTLVPITTSTAVNQRKCKLSCDLSI